MRRLADIDGALTEIIAIGVVDGANLPAGIVAIVGIARDRARGERARDDCGGGPPPAASPPIAAMAPVTPAPAPAAAMPPAAVPATAVPAAAMPVLRGSGRARREHGRPDGERRHGADEGFQNAVAHVGSPNYRMNPSLRRPASAPGAKWDSRRKIVPAIRSHFDQKRASWRRPSNSIAVRFGKRRQPEQTFILLKMTGSSAKSRGSHPPQFAANGKQNRVRRLARERLALYETGRHTRAKKHKARGRRFSHSVPRPRARKRARGRRFSSYEKAQPVFAPRRLKTIAAGQKPVNADWMRLRPTNAVSNSQ